MMTPKEFYNKCYKYLLQIKPKEITDLDKYFIGENINCKTLNEIFKCLTASARNYQSAPNVIQYEKRKKEIDEILYDYDFNKILKNYDYDKLFICFKIRFNIATKDSPNNTWRRWSKSIIDSAKFISNFKNISEFNEFVNCFVHNVFTRVALPMLIDKEISGIGFALACDFIKELGYVEYCKPDVHIIEVLNHFDSVIYDQYGAFKRFIEIALEADVTSYKLDKIVWLICSGNFYKDDIKIGSHKTELIKILNEC